MTNRREIIVPEQQLKRNLRKMTRRGFLVGGVAALGGLGAYEWITNAASEADVPWPQRRVLDFNAKLAHAYLGDSHLMPTYSLDQVSYLKPNGNEGLDPSEDLSAWQMKVEPAGVSPVTLELADIQALPKVEMITRLCCIEGWSAVVHWGGARFSDFTKKYFPPGRELSKFVYMATPDEDYFVGLDMKSAMHPQTLLAWERNGKPLDPVHGAPLRLVIPVKYGIKNIKRIGLIRYTDQRPGDYWAEEGYDWFAGL